MVLLFVGLQRGENTLLYTAAIPFLIMVLGGIALYALRIDRPNLALWLQVVVISLGVPWISFLLQGMGWIILVSVPLVILILGVRLLPGKHMIASLMIASLSGVAGLLLDLNGPSNRTILPTADIWPVVAILAIFGLGVYFLVQRFQGFSLRTKLSSLFLLAALLPLGFLIYINNRATQNALTEAANSALASVAGQTGQQIDSFIQETILSLENQAQLIIFRNALTASPDLFELLESDVLQTLQVLLNENPDYLLSYTLLNREGTYITGVPRTSQAPPPFLGINQNIVNSLQVSLSAGLSYISPVILHPETGSPTIYFASTITTQEGIPTGLLVATYDAKILQDIITNGNNTAGDGSYGVLYDENHTQLAHGLAPETNFKTLIPLDDAMLEILLASNRLPNLRPEVLSQNLPELHQGMVNSRRQPIFTLEPGEGVANASQVAVHRLESRPWRVAFFQARDIFLTPANQQTRANLLLGLFFAGIATLIAILSSRVISIPITNLAEIVHLISNGDLSVRVPVTTQDEIGELGSTFNSMTAQIQTLLGGLESQVAARTQELERRAVQLQTAAEVAREASQVQDLDTLLSEAVNLISQRFGFYHAGIFLLDEKREFAVLQAANSMGGQQMLAQGHKLKVGQVGIVGDTTQSGQPHIALDVGLDRAHFAHANLPDTRSEMALPLKVGDEIIGALDVQSIEEGAFDQEDITILGVLADQLAVAIRNSQLLAEVQQTVKQLQTAYGDYTDRSWREWHQGSRIGYTYRGAGFEPTLEPTAEITQAWTQGQTVTANDSSHSTLAVPLKLRDTVLGVIHLRIHSNQVPEEMIELVNEIGERLALALENARLLETTRQRAAQEQLVSQITTRMRETLDLETILKTATREIQMALGLPEVVIRLGQLTSPPEARS
jgi:GAF domain-containing protein/HAMP domain-containing protein